MQRGLSNEEQRVLQNQDFAGGLGPDVLDLFLKSWWLKHESRLNKPMRRNIEIVWPKALLFYDE